MRGAAFCSVCPTTRALWLLGLSLQALSIRAVWAGVGGHCVGIIRRGNRHDYEVKSSWIKLGGPYMEVFGGALANDWGAIGEISTIGSPVSVWQGI